MTFSLFLSYLSTVFHSFVTFCHLALVTVSSILCIMLCCDDDDDDDDDDDVCVCVCVCVCVLLPLLCDLIAYLTIILLAK